MSGVFSSARPRTRGLPVGALRLARGELFRRASVPAIVSIKLIATSSTTRPVSFLRSVILCTSNIVPLATHTEATSLVNIPILHARRRLRLRTWFLSSGNRNCETTLMEVPNRVVACCARWQFVTCALRGTQSCSSVAGAIIPSPFSPGTKSLKWSTGG